jgi:hypothetical protein
MAKSDPEATVRLDLNNPVFQQNLLTLQKPTARTARSSAYPRVPPRLYQQQFQRPRYRLAVGGGKLPQSAQNETIIQCE